ncbi:hypothetical protein HPG69_004129 [Diceros bicornis minor]|uniref:C-type lectin domain-containing protein n=1 Tax=Diceros bicornis minor TaxID=77932 RepID=A0A7J7E9Q0_DICBM|nr:hypothetical protein HPG69_004129 [Diceros bicornis minor]
MSEEPVIYTTLSQQKHTPKNNIKHKFRSNELPLTKEELKHQKSCKKWHKNTAEDVNGQASSKQSSLTIQQKELGLVQMQLLLFLQGTVNMERESTCLLVSEFQSHKDKQGGDVYHNGIGKHWLWENDSVLSSDMFYPPTPQKGQLCLSYKSREIYLSEDCEFKQTYICKNHLVYSINSLER